MFLQSVFRPTVCWKQFCSFAPGHLCLFKKKLFVPKKSPFNENRIHYNRASGHHIDWMQYSPKLKKLEFYKRKHLRGKIERKEQILFITIVLGRNIYSALLALIVKLHYDIKSFHTYFENNKTYINLRFTYHITL